MWISVGTASGPVTTLAALMPGTWRSASSSSGRSRRAGMTAVLSLVLHGFELQGGPDSLLGLLGGPVRRFANAQGYQPSRQLGWLRCLRSLPRGRGFSRFDGALTLRLIACRERAGECGAD